MRITECGVQVGRPPHTEPLVSDQERERGPGRDFLKDGLCRGSNRDSRSSDEAALARAACLVTSLRWERLSAEGCPGSKTGLAGSAPK